MIVLGAMHENQGGKGRNKHPTARVGKDGQAIHVDLHYRKRSGDQVGA